MTHLAAFALGAYLGPGLLFAAHMIDHPDFDARNWRDLIVIPATILAWPVMIRGRID